mmetsp:Transcript_1597/g.3805  ORF Transcript_1597/g.3805 Transcript_1597/m.3805 type:complete len:210 (-) Transcript_1597:392-1021(-)
MCWRKVSGSAESECPLWKTHIAPADPPVRTAPLSEAARRRGIMFSLFHLSTANRVLPPLAMMISAASILPFRSDGEGDLSETSSEVMVHPNFFSSSVCLALGADKSYVAVPRYSTFGAEAPSPSRRDDGTRLRISFAIRPSDKQSEPEPANRPRKLGCGTNSSLCSGLLFLLLLLLLKSRSDSDMVDTGRFREAFRTVIMFLLLLLVVL